MRIIKKYSGLSLGVKAGLWFTICNLTQKGISFITMPIFTRIMSKEDYGIYTTYLSWYSFLMIFASLNLSFYVFSKGMVKYEDDRNEFVVSLQSLSTTATTIVFIIYLVFYETANKWFGLTTSLMLCMFVQMLFEPSIQYWTARKRFEYDYVKVVLVTLAISFLNPILGIIMVLSAKDDVFARTISATIVYALFGIALYVLIMKKGRKLFSLKYWKYALCFNIPLIPHFLSVTALSQADRVMITNIAGAEYTAMYGVAYNIGMVALLFSQAIQQAMLPWQYTKLKKEEYDNIRTVPSITLVIIVGVCVVLMSFAPEVMIIVAPKSYSAAVWVIPPVCGSVFFMYLFNLFANIEYYYEESKYVAIASVLAAIINIGLNYVFIQLYGFAAAGYTTLSCYILLALGHYYCMKHICKKHNLHVDPYNVRHIIYLSVGMLLIMITMIFVYENILVRYAVIVGICIVCVVRRKQIVQMYKTITSNI